MMAVPMASERATDTRLTPAPTAVLPTALVVLLLVLAVSYDGAFHQRHWAPTALLALVTLLAMHLTGGTAMPRGALRVALYAAWAFAAWSLLSMFWAESPALAWEGANRTILYAALASLALLTAAPPRQLAFVGHALVAGISLLAVITLLRMRANGPDLFLAGRLDSPIGYRNGTAALFAFPVWPLIVIAATRGRSPALRAGALAWAVLCLGLSFATQSRGVALGLVCGGLVALALGPDRVKRAWLALIVVGAVAAVSGPLLEPYDAFTQAGSAADPDAIRHTANALTGITVLVFLGGFAMALLDNGLRQPQLVPLQRAAGVGLALVAIVAVGGALAVVGNPVSYLDDKITEFKDINPSGTLGSTRLGSVGGQRYDLYRVAAKEWRDHPLQGVGEGNYAFDYYRERKTDRNLTDPHSLPLRALAETGLVGLGLLLLFLAALVAALARGWRAAPPDVRRPATALAAAGAVVIGQNSVDWLWLITGLTGLGIVSLSLAAAMVGRSEPAVAPRRGLGWSLAAAGLGVAAVSVLLLFLSDVRIRRAQANASAHPAAALSEAKAAGALNPWSVQSRWARAGALERLGRRAEAREQLVKALDMEPDNFATLGLLGDFEVRSGHPAAARRYYRRALALNPVDVGLQKLARGEFSGD